MTFGQPDFSGLDFMINDAVFRYGAFLTALITFVTTAAALYRASRSSARPESPLGGSGLAHN